MNVAFSASARGANALQVRRCGGAWVFSFSAIRFRQHCHDFLSVYFLRSPLVETPRLCYCHKNGDFLVTTFAIQVIRTPILESSFVSALPFSVLTELTLWTEFRRLQVLPSSVSFVFQPRSSPRDWSFRLPSPSFSVRRHGTQRASVGCLEADALREMTGLNGMGSLIVKDPPHIPSQSSDSGVINVNAETIPILSCPQGGCWK